MIPSFLKDAIESWISNKHYGEFKIFFHKGIIKNWTEGVNKIPPSSGSTIVNPGVKDINKTASQGVKLEENTNA